MEKRAQMAGYSGTPLNKKLGVKPGQRAAILNAPADFLKRLAPLPEGFDARTRLAGELDYIHYFVSKRADLVRAFPRMIQRLATGGMIWISWPKKSSRVPTDLTEDALREIGLPLGVVDVKVCAVDDIWSGLKFMRRTKSAAQTSE
jgi:hypothetical protein